MNKRVLLTGASGFTGAHMLRHLMMNTDWTVVCPVTFKHKGQHERIASSLRTNPEWHPRVDVVHWDLATPAGPMMLDRLGDLDAVLNIASQSHVDRSIEDPVGFIQNNVNLMLNVLELARVKQPKVFMQMSTDEVFGPAPQGYAHEEWDIIKPSNPYAASKAAQEAIAFSYWRTYGVPLIITNTMNLFGEMQDAEKYFAKIMRAVAAGDTVTVHASPDGVIGSRFYIHARNFADAWLHLVRNTLDFPETPDYVQLYEAGWHEPTRFNIVGEQEVTNLGLAQLIADTMGKELRYTLVDFHSSRPGHDLRYALDGRLLETATGWKAPVSFEDSVRKTVQWTLEHPEWLS